ncbi:MAG: oligosaccharide flippase family protein [Clostridium perfringens]|nr:oligosaccharide flippase family protein [Clostridium perfringens]
MANFKNSSNSKDSIFLATTKLFTTAVGIISTMILSKMLSLQMVGTYSAANTMTSLLISLTILGLADGCNYFFNKTLDQKKQKEYVDTILGIQLFVGIISVAVVMIFRNEIIDFYDNKALYGLLIYICLRPYLENTLLVLQVLQIAIGKAKMIAVRNAIMSLFKIIVISLTAIYTKDIKTIFIAFVIADIVMVILFGFSFVKHKYKLNPFNIKISFIKPILAFSIPMGIYVMTNTFARDLDKLVIGRFETASNLAIYSNCSTLLPFDIISSAFLTVMIPIMTRYISQNKLEKCQILFSCYLKVGYLSTFVFTTFAILFADEIICFLYDPKYLSGKIIFILYTVVSMLKFANLSLVLSAKGRTKTLMRLSLFTLLSNIILNLLFYYIWGFIGPAIATVLITVFNTVFLLVTSANIIGTNVIELIDFENLGRFLFELLIGSIITVFIKNTLLKLDISKYLIMILVGGCFCFVILLINFKEIKNTFIKIDSMKIEN